MTDIVESLRACTGTACSCIWWSVEADIVNSFTTKHPLISLAIASAEALCRNQSPQLISQALASADVFCRNQFNFVLGRLNQRQVTLDTNLPAQTRDGSSPTINSELKLLPAAAHFSKWSSSKSLMIVSSGIVLLGTGYFASNYIGMHLMPSYCESRFKI
jgi:hypothetical protein